MKESWKRNIKNIGLGFIATVGSLGVHGDSDAQIVKDSIPKNPTENKDSVDIPFVSTPKGQELLKKYAFTQPTGTNDDYFDEIQYVKLPTEGLDREQINNLMEYIRNPLIKIPNPTVVSVEKEGPNIDYDPGELDLYTGNKDRANIDKYRPDENLRPKKPFGYGEPE